MFNSYLIKFILIVTKCNKNHLKQDITTLSIFNDETVFLSQVALQDLKMYMKRHLYTFLQLFDFLLGIRQPPLQIMLAIPFRVELLLVFSLQLGYPLRETLKTTTHTG